MFLIRRVESKINLVRCMSQLPQAKTDDEFRVLNLKHVKNQTQFKRKPKPVGALPPRTNQMPIDQDWGNVWPGPKTFHPASVPLPVRQGYTKKGAPPGKFGNAELMKIPNFLHLTPPAIKQQCEALKKFCTPWPKNLETDEKCRKHFPINIISSDYCHASPTIRDPLSRIVSVKVKLSDLQLNQHARDKLLRLVGDRYDEATDDLTIVTDRCPTRKQNYDYALYLLTALYHESWTVEDWEKEKVEEDMELYDWETSKAKQAVSFINTWSPSNPNGDSNVDANSLPNVEGYKNAVVDLRNNGETDEVYERYGEATRKLLNLS